MHIDTGNTAFMLICSALVMLMTPGLAFFYAGFVGHKNVLAVMMQSFVSMGVTTILWYAVGYSLCFSGGEGGVIGNLDHAFLRGITMDTPSPANDTIPAYVFFVYQLMFAIITPALITGAFTNRVSFKAYLVFLVGWLMLVYFPFVHMVWGNGILAKHGVLDFAGGIVVHNIAGIAALASVFYVGKRKVDDSEAHSIPIVALGTGMLWFGWFGFNAGSEFRVDGTTTVAFLNTHLAAAFASMTWLFIEWTATKRPKFLGFLTGGRAVTPCAGFSPRASRRKMGCARLWGVTASPPAVSAAIIGASFLGQCAGRDRVLGHVRIVAKVRVKRKMGPVWDDALDVRASRCLGRPRRRSLIERWPIAPSCVASLADVQRHACQRPP
jgi:Amt family ammonium transporter